jgi:hypothetical protein
MRYSFSRSPGDVRRRTHQDLRGARRLRLASQAGLYRNDRQGYLLQLASSAVLHPDSRNRSLRLTVSRSSEFRRQHRDDRQFGASQGADGRGTRHSRSVTAASSPPFQYGGRRVQGGRHVSSDVFKPHVRFLCNSWLHCEASHLGLK